MNSEKVRTRTETSPLAQNQKAASRRRFLQTAATAGLMAATVPVSGIANVETERHKAQPQDSAAEILCRHGSEFGDLRQVR